MNDEIRECKRLSITAITQVRMKDAYSLRRHNFDDTIQFDIPHSTRAISVSGAMCSLDCAHCGGYYLQGMTPLSEEVQLSGCTSVLVSGGCDLTGQVNMVKHIGFFQRAREQGIRINAHLGLMDQDHIRQVAPLIDCVSFDFLTDGQTIRDVYGLRKTADDYIETYLELRKHTRVVPHICVGLHKGSIRGEYEALKKLKELGVDSLVFIVFIPTPGTRYQHLLPPSLESVAELLATARLDFPTTPISLGCMRPKGRYRAELDCIAVRCGLNKIVNPTGKAVDLALRLGLSIIKGRECCVL